jgi:hypothetical protein
MAEQYPPHAPPCFASVANDLGFTEPTISAILGHAAGSVTGRYVHHLDAALIAAADRVSRSIHKMMNGEAADVIAFPTVAPELQLKSTGG